VHSLASDPADAHNARSSTSPGQGLKWIRRLVVVNLGLVAFQALSAGLFMSGYAPALPLHAAVGLALQLGGLAQALGVFVLWRRGRVPAWVVRASVGLFIVAFVQVGAGYTRRYWLHVPIGVGLFGGLMRQASRLDTKA